ncbi:MAG: retroviral-like aspartic protease family protein [Erythrobacter sp.]|uniref:retroviral-like aspartic protease family protein n=1 Tax=Erythrobacter sp. TaxID=1042 RepID=UPI0026157600|nr:retroviral-like aspartic protease family protein [Erythrobacter sp.]MDJ0978977.1 retroviral-like aspartic protease family protein [Erythrobacter sp.]
MLEHWAYWTLTMGLAPALTADHAASVFVEPDKNAAEQAIAPSLTDPSTEILALDEERNQRLTVPVLIDGAGPFNFMIDTGSQATAVTHEINASLGLNPLGTATLVGMASTRPVDIVEVETLKVGSYEVFDLVAPVLSRTNVGADGIIGLDSLQDFRVLIDFRDESIAVEDMSNKKSNRRGFEIVVRAKQELGQLLITDAIVEGVKATVIIDTGAQASLANTALKERIRAKRAQEVVTTDVNGVSLTGDLAYVRSLTIEGLSLRNVPLAFADAPAFEALGLKDTPVLSLGMQHLKMFDRVAIDFANRRILFDVPRDVAREMRRARQPGLRANFN